MKITDIQTDDQLWEFMTEPTEGLVELLRGLSGGIMVLGGSGRKEAELTGLLLRAEARAGRAPGKISVASRFDGLPPDGKEAALLQGLGGTVYRGDPGDKKFLDTLPDAENVIYMPEVQFDSSMNWEKSATANCIAPYLAAEKYRDSRIVIFSSGDLYVAVDQDLGGSLETDALKPAGIRGWSMIGRESAFRVACRASSGQKACCCRLGSAQHLAYGTLADLSRLLLAGENISAAVPRVSLISQRDANDRALRSLGLCSNPPAVLNIAGPSCTVEEAAVRLGELLGRKPDFIDAAPATALMMNDSRCTGAFGPYRDGADDMIKAAAAWSKRQF